MISWPRRLPQGQVRSQLATACDWLPTICALIGVPAPAVALDGKDLGPILASESAPSPHPVFHWALGRQWAVRAGKWKLLANPRDTTDGRDPVTHAGKSFLYDLETDPGESIDRSAEHPVVMERLRKLHETWAAELPPR